MAVGCGPKLSKGLLIIFNIIFWLSGAALIGSGIYVLVSSELSFIGEFASDDRVLQNGGYILIGIGCLVFIVGFCGCCGAIQENRCLLGAYIFFLVIIMAGELAAGAYAAIKRKALMDSMEKELSKSFRIYNNKSPKNGLETFQKLYGKLFESGFACCGVNKSQDYEGTTLAEFSNVTISMYCCKDFSKNPSKYDNFWKDSNKREELKTCFNSKNYNTKGCLQQVKDKVVQKLPIIIGVGIGIAFLQLVGIVLAVCLCRNTGEEA